MNLASKLSAATLALALSPIAYAQTPPAAPKPDTAAVTAKPSAEAASTRPNADTFPERTFYLTNVPSPDDANEIVTSLRNTLPSNDRIYLVYSQNAIVTRASADDDALIQKLLNDLDRPKKNYRLTYTVTEMDGSKQIGTEHYAMIMASGQATTLKLGSKVPVATGSYSASGNVGVQTQFSYIDVGMNFDATLTAMGDGAMLKSSVEDSSVSPEKSVIGGVTEPIVRQSSLKSESVLAPGKPVLLGSVDIPGGTSHLDIEVVLQPLP
jgi:type II secretory pathway component GspD/PulD (secretin)